jgi:hypothetical protein
LSILSRGGLHGDDRLEKGTARRWSVVMAAHQSRDEAVITKR